MYGCRFNQWFLDVDGLWFRFTDGGQIKSRLLHPEDAAKITSIPYEILIFSHANEEKLCEWGLEVPEWEIVKIFGEDGEYEIILYDINVLDWWVREKLHLLEKLIAIYKKVRRS